MSEEELIKATMMLDYSQLVMNNVYCHKEIERLNNIINELEKWCNESMYDDDQLYENVLDKLQELKGSDK